ncbi:MAG: MFS transporter [Clostridia bacterium]|nr:MFS transporter [Clostridia bacterium]MDE7328241.1 MFS transporter [Clostridia bacterium]
MKRLKSYKHTFNSCCVASSIQAITINLAPLLFVSFQEGLGISLTKLTALITVTFLVQLLMDAVSAKIIDKIGYRTSVILSHVFAAAGLILLATLPFAFSDGYLGLMIATIVCAIGGGIAEVIISPVVEAIPEKAGNMSLLHSFYCFGYLFVVLITVVYFQFFPKTAWQTLVLALSLIPIANGIFFFFVPCSTLDEQRGESMRLRDLFKNKRFYLFVILITCAGACEQAISQWVSYFAEIGLNLSKTVGDLVGPFTFALLMGLGRLFYGLFGKNIRLAKIMPLLGAACLACYIVVVVSNIPLLSLIVCALCGLAVSIMWPATLDLASRNISKGGTAMFALLALGGDVGCTLGPSLVGYVSDSSSYGLKGGLATAMIFALLFFLASLFIGKLKKPTPKQILENNLNNDLN